MMKDRIPSPAMLVALIALFIALGGAGYAALKVPKNSVGSKQLKKNSVTAKKIKKNAVTTPKVKNGAITAAKLAPGTVSTDANTLNGFAANGLARTAVAFSNSQTNKTGQATLLSTTITAPGPGYLIVNASTDVRSTIDAFISCSLQLDEAGMDGSGRFLATKIGTAFPEIGCVTGSTMPVQAGQYKVDFEGQGADADVKWGRSSLQATFVPFGPDGNRP